MELNYFRDKLFDLLNDSDDMGISDLSVNEREKLIVVSTEDGTMIEIKCRLADK